MQEESANKEQKIPKVRKNAAKPKDKSMNRKKVVLNVLQRQEVLEKLSKGVTIKKIAEEYGIGLSTVSDIKNRGKEALLKYGEESPLSLERKIAYNSFFPELDHALKIWVYQERAKNNPISQAIISAKAKAFYDQLYGDLPDKKEFKASTGFVASFCDRHSIKLKQINTEPQLAANSVEAKNKLITKFLNFLQDYNPYQIYTADECGLNYDSLPNNTLTTPLECGFKVERNRITMMACSNAAATHRLPLVFIHKHQNPHCFISKAYNKKNRVAKPTLPVYYCSSKRAWMTQDIFVKWFHTQFVPQVESHLDEIKAERKAVLLIDNCPVHPFGLVSKNGNIKCVFFPPGTSFSPMEKGAITCLKRKYRTRLLKKLVLHNKSIEQFFNEFTIKDVIYMLADIWSEMPVDLIKSSWHKLSMNLDVQHVMEEIKMEEINIHLAKLGWNFSDFEVRNWLDNDSDDYGYASLTDSEIITESITYKEHKHDDSTLNDNDDHTPHKCMTEHESSIDQILSMNKALGHLSEVINWLEVQSEAKQDDFILYRLKKLAEAKKYDALTGTTLRKFFKEHKTPSNNNSTIITVSTSSETPPAPVVFATESEMTPQADQPKIPTKLDTSDVEMKSSDGEQKPPTTSEINNNPNSTSFSADIEMTVTNDNPPTVNPSIDHITLIAVPSVSINTTSVVTLTETSTISNIVTLTDMGPPDEPPISTTAATITTTPPTTPIVLVEAIPATQLQTNTHETVILTDTNTIDHQSNSNIVIRKIIG